MSYDAESFLSKYNFSTLVGSIGFDPEKVLNARRQFEGMTSSAFTSNTSPINLSIVSYLQQKNPDLLAEYLKLSSKGTNGASGGASIFAKETPPSPKEAELTFIDFTPPPERVTTPPTDAPVTTPST